MHVSSILYKNLIYLYQYAHRKNEKNSKQSNAEPKVPGLPEVTWSPLQYETALRIMTIQTILGCALDHVTVVFKVTFVISYHVYPFRAFASHLVVRVTR